MFSPHVLDPDLLTLTLASRRTHPFFRFSHLIWAADPPPPTGRGQADAACGLMTGVEELIFTHTFSHLFYSFQLCLITQL